MILRSFILPLIIISVTGCSGDVSREKQENAGKLKEHLVNANKIFVEKEAEQIAAYQKRHRLEMTTTGTGLRYFIYHNNADKVYPQPGDTVELGYQVFLLDGTPCYDTRNAPEVFTLGKAEMPRGMEEAVEMMQTGDSSIIILPSHLAYGFTGDGDKIPGNAATVYYISLKKISKAL
jgi:FKBP-type peptidyl-prolyl cis-trans isomerase FkpA